MLGRLVMGHIMRSLGFAVLEACDGQDALSQLEHRAPPQVALIDRNTHRRARSRR